MSFVEVDSNKFELFLSQKGFIRTVRNYEIVYYKRHELDNRYIILVYTSIKVGNITARNCGTDCIRVCAIYSHVGSLDIARGVVKLPRVYRNASSNLSDEERQLKIFNRTLSRMRAAYDICNKYIKKGKYNEINRENNSSRNNRCRSGASI